MIIKFLIKSLKRNKLRKKILYQTLKIKDLQLKSKNKFLLKIFHLKPMAENQINNIHKPILQKFQKILKMKNNKSIQRFTDKK